MNAPCPICGHAVAEDLGPPVRQYPTTVAGMPIDLTDLDSRWWRCASCGFLFLDPPIPHERLQRCYESADPSYWSTDSSVSARRSYDAKRKLLEQHAPGRRVLDFGCFDGGFLAFLGARFDRYGIEPSTAASRIAEERGIKILGRTVEDAAPSPAMDAIIAFDVFEHIPDPVQVLRAFRERLAPRGIVMIETGNSDEPYWRRVGTRYLYLSHVEHIGAFNRSSLLAAAQRAGFVLEHFSVAPHEVRSPRERFSIALYQWAYEILRVWDKLKLPLSRRLRGVARGPVPRVSGDDHFLAILRRDD